MIRGINIISHSQDKLGRDLTNPSYAKNGITDFDISPNKFYPEAKWILPKNYLLSDKNRFKWVIRKFGNNITAEQIWGNSVEAWYFANTENISQISKEVVMLKLIICKLKTYTKLVDQIDERGGIEFLKSCSHIISGKKIWEGVGENSRFIKILIEAYLVVKGCRNDSEQMYLKL